MRTWRLKWRVKWNGPAAGRVKEGGQERAGGYDNGQQMRTGGAGRWTRAARVALEEWRGSMIINERFIIELVQIRSRLQFTNDESRVVHVHEKKMKKTHNKKNYHLCGFWFWIFFSCIARKLCFILIYFQISRRYLRNEWIIRCSSLVRVPLRLSCHE